MVTTRSQSQLKNKATASPQATKPAAKQPRKKQAPATEQQPPAEQPRPLSVKDRNAGMGGGQSKGASKPDSHPIASLPGSPAAGAAPAVGFPLPAGEASQEQQPAAAAAPEPAAPAAQEPVPAEQQPAPAAAERPLPQPKPLSVSFAAALHCHLLLPVAANRDTLLLVHGLWHRSVVSLDSPHYSA